MVVKRALLIGCNYPGSEQALRGCVNDVKRIKQILLDRFGFDEENIVMMIDTDQSLPQPTGANIRKAFKQLVSGTRSGDVIFVHYSGHGVEVPAETGDQDDNGADQCIVPCDLNLITDDDFRDIVNTIPPGVDFTFVSDSCHSGGLIEHEKEQIGEDSAGGGGGGGGAATREFRTRGLRRGYGEEEESGGYGDGEEGGYGGGHGRGGRGRRGEDNDGEYGGGYREEGGYGEEQDNEYGGHGGRHGRHGDGEEGGYRGGHGRGGRGRRGEDNDGEYEGGYRDEGEYGEEQDNGYGGHGGRHGRHGRRDDDEDDGEEDRHGRHGHHGRHGRHGEDEEEEGGYGRRHGGGYGGGKGGGYGGRYGGDNGGRFGGGYEEDVGEPPKARSLPLDLLMKLLSQKSGQQVGVGNIRTSLFGIFGEDASPMVQNFVGVLVAHAPEIMQALSGKGESTGGLLGTLSHVALDFVKQQAGFGNPHAAPARPTTSPVPNTTLKPQQVYAGYKPPAEEIQRTGILISGCQHNETSADACPDGNPENAYGALSNAIATVLAEEESPISNYDLVTRVRKILQDTKFTQHPCLYSSDEHAQQPFICSV